MMELIFTFILSLMNLLPAIIMTIVAFFINPIIGIVLGSLFVLIAIITSIVQIRKIIKNKDNN
jgi:Ca2+/Na+ antiporter